MKPNPFARYMWALQFAAIVLKLGGWLMWPWYYVLAYAELALLLVILSWSLEKLEWALLSEDERARRRLAAKLRQLSQAIKNRQ